MEDHESASYESAVEVSKFWKSNKKCIIAFTNKKKTQTKILVYLSMTTDAEYRVIKNP